MEKRIIEYLTKSDLIKHDARDIAEEIQATTSSEFTEFSKCLNKLENRRILIRDKNNQFSLFDRVNFTEGKIVIKDKGFGFVTSSLYDEDIFIPKGYTLTAVSGDIVLIEVEKSHKGFEGIVQKIIKRAYQYIYGTIKKEKNYLFVSCDDSKINVIVKLSEKESKKYKIGDKVKAKITRYDSSGYCHGEVVELIGKKDDPFMDITMLVNQSGLRQDFLDETIRCANSLPTEVELEEVRNRKDIRDKLIVTIDGADAKDFDDAINVGKLNNGNYLLGVYIADVSHYVTPSSPLDSEAYDRSFSIYLPDRVIPMLPEKLSNGLCSLRPNEDRLVLACEMEINQKGEVVAHDIFEATIKSKARLIYHEVNEFLEGKKTYNKDIEDMLIKANELAKILNDNRKNRGSLDFEVKESKITLDDRGRTIDVSYFERGESEQMIEEFMLKANETVAEVMSYLEVPFIYRVHDEPKSDRLHVFTNIARLLGYKIPRKGVNIHPKQLQTLLIESKNNSYGTIIHNLLLRCQAKARYSDTNIGHYGLASACYTHFTSPIRRYSDLIVHRLVKEYYLQKDVNDINNEEVVAYVSEKTTETERAIKELERNVEDMKKAEFMMHHIGETFQGVITSVVKWGFYVQLSNTVEGLVHHSTFNFNDYEFDEDALMWYSHKKNKLYRIGDIVEVTVVRASKFLREIDFIIKEKDNEKKQ